MNFKEMRARMAEAATKAKAEAMKQAAKVETRLKDTERNRAMVASFVEKVGATLEELVDEGAPREERKIIDLTYVTDRFIAMGFPWDGRSSAGSAAPRQTANPIKAVAAHLRSYHEGHYMVLNVSEEQYDYGTFDMNVLEFEFQGTAPPRHALQDLRVAGVRRYVQYFSNVLDGVAPRSEPLLRRAIMHGIPNRGRRAGCCPHLQFFKGGRLAYTTTRSSTRGGDRFDDDFFVDLIFAPLERENDEDGGNDAPGGSAAGAAQAGLWAEAARETSDAGGFSPAYDALLHKDSLFWRDIEDRKTRAPARGREEGRRRTGVAAAARVPAPPAARWARRAADPIFAIGGEDTPAKAAPVADLLSADTDDLNELDRAGGAGARRCAPAGDDASTSTRSHLDTLGTG
ncbi:phosphatase [Aureococcus anophagefferens]|nr:phosphatase [Aureococcus anophagefferens]